MRRFLVVAAMVVLFAAPTSVAAQDPDPMTVDFASAHLMAKVVVNVEVRYSCQPKPELEFPWASMWENGPSLSIRIQQAIGRLQAFGQAELYPLSCDGQEQNVVVSVVADPSGPAFKSGAAAIIIEGWAGYLVENYENWEESYFVDQRDSTGWLRSRLGK
jgi:hypothetical protein